jgi:hypothetical protein
MKPILLLIAIALTSTAKAEVITCPSAYPSAEMILSAAPSGHTGSGIIRGAPLNNAYVYIGKLHSDPNGFDAMQLIPRVIKGGWETEDNFTREETKWLVCLYGGDRKGAGLVQTTGPIEWWEQIDPKISHCVLKVMKIKLTYSDAVHLTATATCR